MNNFQFVTFDSRDQRGNQAVEYGIKMYQPGEWDAENDKNILFGKWNESC